jgi:FtsZ-interacting cell division protein YlmF
LRCCLATIEQSQAQRWWDFVVGGVDCLCAGDGPVQTRTYGNKTRNMAIS